MTGPSSIAAAQLESLLRNIERERQTRIAEELGAARSRAAQMLKAARAAGRRRVGDAIAQERARLAEALRRAEAAQATRARRAEHAGQRDVMAIAWQRLPAALEARWSSTAGRREWCESAIGLAGLMLRESPWTIELAPGATPGEIGALADQARSLRSGEHRIIELDALRAGLRIRAPGAVIDTTLDGLLFDRVAIEARLVAEWQRAERLQDEVATIE